MDSDTKTIGEARVRTDFNVENNSNIDLLKKSAAKFIDQISAIKDGEYREDSREVGRLKSMAMTAVEEAAMWAVKAETSRVATPATGKGQA